MTDQQPRTISISIVIVTWNSQKVLSDCVLSLFHHVPASSFELILVDNASKDPAYLDAYGDKPNVKVVRNFKNLGYAKAVNIGLQEASGAYFLILNPDTVFLSNPFPRLIQEMKADPKIGVVAPLLHDGNNKPQISGYYPKFPTISQYFLSRTLFAKTALFRALSDRFYHASIGTVGLHEVEQIPGAFMFFHRDLFGKAPLNEAYFIWMEDVDFCFRVYEKKLKVVVVADEKIIHIGGTSFTMRDMFWKKPIFTQSYLTYLDLYYKPGPYIVHVALMSFDTLARVGFLLLFYPLKKAPKETAAKLRMEARILGLILSHTLAHFKNAWLKSKQQ
jgi:GT2 family glycosyltransferase